MIRKIYNRTTSQLQLKAQKDVLDFFCKSEIKSKKISLPSGSLNYIDIVKPSLTAAGAGAVKSTLILTHGYGSGLGFFYANYDALCSQYDRVIAVDWLGMGASSRDVNIAKPIIRRACSTTSWCTQAHQATSNTYSSISGNSANNSLRSGTMTPTRAADFFIDSLEELRNELNLTSFVLAGHSLGGYLSGRYAHKYPKEVAGLVLISPVGVPSWPHADRIVPSSSMSLGYQLLNSAWKSNFTPQSIIRIAGATKGEKTVRSILQRRFGKDKFDEQQVELLSRYLYQITAAKPCGEYAMNSLLLPIISVIEDAAGVQDQGQGQGQGQKHSTSVFAHEPLETLYQGQIPGHGQSGQQSGQYGQGLNIPSVLVMYGDHDWLYYPQIEQCLRSWERTSGVAANYVHIPRAGHHIYLDNPDYFHRVMGQYKHSVYK